MNHAFQIPTVHKDGFHRKRRSVSNLHIIINGYGSSEFKLLQSVIKIEGIEVFQSFYLPVIIGDKLDNFIKVNAN